MLEETYFIKPEVANKYDIYIGINIPFYWPTLDFIGEKLCIFFPSERALDCIEIGCGSANLSITISKYFAIKNLLLVDHSAEFLKIAKQKITKTLLAPRKLTSKNISFLSNNWENDVQPHTQDLILSSLTLDHIAEDKIFLSLLKKLYNLLKEGGCLVIAEKCASSDQTTSSWKSFVKMIDIRGENNLKNNFKNLSEIAAWKDHIFHEDTLRPFADIWTLSERAGFTIKYAGGVPLPEPENLNYDTFYQLNKISSLTRQEVFSSVQAFGIAILICQK